MKKVYFIISIDTECDKDTQWQVPQPMRFYNIREQENTLFPVFKDNNIKPTYLLSPEVLKDNDSVEFFKNTDLTLELGTHLHTEFIEPNANMGSLTTSGIQLNLPKEIEFQKLKNLTELFKNQFGYQPKSFRSGRFGSSENTTSILSELNYFVDSSIVPYSTKRFGDKYIDSWHHKLKPYWERFGDKKILQVPLTLVNPGYSKLPFFLKYNIGQPNSTTKKIAKKLGYSLKTSWLRPFRSKTSELIQIAEIAINEEFKNEDFAVINVMFHSNELYPKASPYCLTQKDVEEFTSSIDKLFKYLSSKYNLCSIGLSDLYDIYNQK